MNFSFFADDEHVYLHGAFCVKKLVRLGSICFIFFVPAFALPFMHISCVDKLKAARFSLFVHILVIILQILLVSASYKNHPVWQMKCEKDSSI